MSGSLRKGQPGKRFPSERTLSKSSFILLGEAPIAEEPHGIALSNPGGSCALSVHFSFAVSSELEKSRCPDRHITGG
jgi:hypothetical protein